MNKTKFLILAGAVTLAITAAFSSKSSNKFAGATSAFFQNSGGTWVTLFKGISATASRLTTVQSTNPSARINTAASGTSYQLYLTKATTTPLYYKP